MLELSKSKEQEVPSDNMHHEMGRDSLVQHTMLTVASTVKWYPEGTLTNPLGGAQQNRGLGRRLCLRSPHIESDWVKSA